MAQSVTDPLTLRFTDVDLESRFQRSAGASSAPQFRVGLCVAAGLWLIAAFLLPRFAAVDPRLGGTVATVMILANLLALAVSLHTSSLDGQHAIGTVINLLAGLAVLWLAVDAGDRYAAPALMLISIFAFVVLRLRFVAAIVVGAVYLVAFAAVTATHDMPRTLVIDAFLLLSAVGSAVAATYFLESAEREVFRQRERIAEQEAALRVEKSKSDRLLRNILPESIVDELRENERSVARKLDSATIVFADLVGFTPLAERTPPEETAAMLNDFYSRFDEASARHGVEKIKTIGDAYMAAAGVPLPCADHAARAVAFALELLEIIHGNEAGLALRIGIHSGPVVAGVIGKTKFSYDLWGDTVNVASRLESQGVPGAIQLSEATLALLGGRFPVSSRGPIELKGRGPVVAFLVER